MITWNRKGKQLENFLHSPCKPFISSSAQVPSSHYYQEAITKLIFPAIRVIFLYISENEINHEQSSILEKRLEASQVMCPIGNDEISCVVRPAEKLIAEDGKIGIKRPINT